MPLDRVQRVLVVGTGLMGPGIAFTYASVGRDVTIYGRSPASVERGLGALRAAAATLADGGIIGAEQAAQIVGRVSGATDLEAAAASADLVAESIVESLDAKRELFARVERLVAPATLLTSNTSGIPATLLQSALERPERFAVTHFWNPPHLMPLVEVVKGERTAEDTMDVLLELLRAAGKRPVAVLRDTPGQLGNRLFHALIREALYIVQEGIASAEDVDTALKTGLGRRFPVFGTLEHLDNNGLEMVLAIQGYMCKELCNSLEPSRHLQALVASGNLGVKTGRGYYDWSQKDIQALVKRRDDFLVQLLREGI